MFESLVVFVRGIIAFGTLLIFARLLGKQQISQLNFFDYILGITIGSIASSLTIDLTSSAWPHWIGLLTWTIAVLLLQIITVKWRRASKYFDGEPTIVIMNGKIMENTSKKMRYRTDDLMEQLRQKNVFDITQVQFAILEKDGELSVIKKPEFENVTKKDLNIQTGITGIATELIYDGIIIDANLKQTNHDHTWLFNELKKLNIQSLSEVFFMSLNPDGTIYTDLYRDHIENLTDITDSLKQS